jgi:hypothetical protein
VGCRPGACVCGPGRPGDEALESLRRIAESSKTTSKFATKFLMNPMFSGCTNWPKPEKGKVKKRVAVVPAASVATAVGLGREEGGAPPAKRPNRSLLVEAVYALGALAGDPRANAHCMELHNEDVARRATQYASAQEQICTVRAWIVFFFFKCTMLYALVTRAPCQAPSSSCSLNRRTYTPKVSSTRLPKAPLYPLLSPPSIRASRASYPWCCE